MDKFSVLISVYYKECPAYLDTALNSVFEQTVVPSEVVIVKDGKLTSELDSVIDLYQEKYPEQIKIVSLPQNVGLGQALNRGLEACTSELVARMDSDDISLSGRFKKQLSVFKRFPQIDVVGGWISEFIDDPHNIVSVRKLPEHQEELLRYSKKRSPLNHVSVMFKKSAVLQAGSYQHFPLMEDYYLWVRMLMNGAQFYNIQESLVLVRNSNEMYNRRGGFRYARTESRFFKYLYKIHYIGLFLLITNVCIRFVVRIIPNRLRKQVYLKTLR